jgi:uncharacterized protein with HEPN domain
MRIRDGVDSIAKIERYVEGMTFEMFSTSDITIDAVVRNMEIIGEAANHVPADIQHRYPHVPWTEMRGMRNILAHEYFAVSLPILWQTVTGNLPPVPPMLETILAAEGTEHDLPEQ